MGFALGHLLKAILLFINAAAILNEERFLARIGWGPANLSDPGFTAPNSVKSKIITLISSVQTLLRIPLIALNIVWVLFELVLG